MERVAAAAAAVAAVAAAADTAEAEVADVDGRALLDSLRAKAVTMKSRAVGDPAQGDEGPP